MALILQPRADGYRVVRMGEIEQMVASVRTKAAIMSGDPRYPDLLEAEKQRLMAEGNPIGSSAIKDLLNAMPTFYTALPRGECTIRDAGGSLTVADVEEILAGIPNV